MKNFILIGATIILLGAGCAGAGGQQNNGRAKNDSERKPSAEVWRCGLVTSDGQPVLTKDDAEKLFGGDWEQAVEKLSETNCEVNLNRIYQGIYSQQEKTLVSVEASDSDFLFKFHRSSNPQPGETYTTIPGIGEDAYAKNFEAGKIKSSSLVFKLKGRTYIIYCSKDCTNDEHVSLARIVIERATQDYPSTQVFDNTPCGRALSKQSANTYVYTSNIESKLMPSELPPTPSGAELCGWAHETEGKIQLRAFYAQKNMTNSEVVDYYDGILKNLGLRNYTRYEKYDRIEFWTQSPKSFQVNIWFKDPETGASTPGTYEIISNPGYL